MRPSIWDARHRAPRAAYPRVRRATWIHPPIWPCTGWGLPGRRVAAPPVRSYRTFSPLPASAAEPGRTPKPRAAEQAVYFLWHLPAGFPDWSLASTLLYGVRTFLAAKQSCLRPKREPEKRRRGRSACILILPAREPSLNMLSVIYLISLIPESCVRTQKSRKPPGQPRPKYPVRRTSDARASALLSAGPHKT